MLKILIIIFISIFAIIDIIAIVYPSIKKRVEEKKRQKRQAAFREKMKRLEIK